MIMRLSGLIASNLLVIACATAGQSGSELEASKPATQSYSEQVAAPCAAFETQDFGTKTTAALRGRVSVSHGEDQLPQHGVTVVVRDFASGRVYQDVSDSKGRFEVPDLLPGRHRVWGCLEGYDVVTFTLIVDPSAPADGVDIVLSPSESGGVSRVVVLRSSPNS